VVTPDGACACCGRRDSMSSGGCAHCNSVRTICGCGAILRCGCGRASGDHACPSVSTSSVEFTVPIAMILCEVEVPW
jgi:hypothetical protein